METSIFILAALPICGSTFVVGRLSRIFWKKIPKAKSQPNQTKLLAAGLGLSSVAGYSFYNRHTNPCPITGKNKFAALSTEQMKTISHITMEYFVSPDIEEKEPVHSALNQQVGFLLKRLISTNQEVPNMISQNWNMTTVNKPYITNAESLPTGDILLYRGMIDLVSRGHGSLANLGDNSSLAFVLSHEMAHVVLDHHNQELTRVIFTQACLWFPMVVVWASFPRILLGFGLNFLMLTLVNVTCNLPWEREEEIEADMLAIDIMKRGGFDITEAPKFFSKIMLIEGLEDGDKEFAKIMEYFSSHPSSETRRQLLMEMIYHQNSTIM